MCSSDRFSSDDPHARLRLDTVMSEKREGSDSIVVGGSSVRSSMTNLLSFTVQV